MQNWKLFPLLACASCYGQTMSPGPATVIRDDGVVTLERALTHESDLWVVPADLPRVNGFELKPEGACLDALCVPASEDGPDPLLLSRDGSQWFSVTGLARRLAQAVVAAPERRVWSLGPIALARRAYFDSAIAPDFELPNRRWRARPPIRFPRQESPPRDLGLLVRVPPRPARLAGCLREAR